MNAREIAFRAIERERSRQDDKWGRHSQGVPAWLLIMEEELREAKEAWVTGSGSLGALEEIVQVAAVAVACLEQHGVIESRRLRPADDPS